MKEQEITTSNFLRALPKETFGTCRYARKAGRREGCGNFQTTLGNGLCVECWDRRVSSKAVGVRRENFDG